MTGFITPSTVISRVHLLVKRSHLHDPQSQVVLTYYGLTKVSPTVPSERIDVEEIIDYNRLKIRKRFTPHRLYHSPLKVNGARLMITSTLWKNVRISFKNTKTKQFIDTYEEQVKKSTNKIFKFLRHIQDLVTTGFS